MVFFTGLSGSGKSTVARGLRDALLERGSRTVTYLDGDVVRHLLSAGLTFSKKDRDLNIRRIGFVAAEAARHGGLAICAPIAPYAATREEVRAMVEAVGADFLLVHVSTPWRSASAATARGSTPRPARGSSPSSPASPTRTRSRTTPTWRSTPPASAWTGRCTRCSTR